MKVSGKPDQYDDLGVFVREQALLRRLAATSILPVLELDLSDDDVPAAADRIADWLGGDGGLSSPWGAPSSPCRLTGGPLDRGATGPGSTEEPEDG